MMRKTVAHIIGLYLPLTQTFIYEYLKNIKSFESIVVTEKVQNLELFPYDNLCIVRQRSRAEKAVDKISYMLTGRRPAKQSSYEKIVVNREAQLLHGHFGWSAATTVPLKRSLGLPLVTTFYGVDVSALPKQNGWLEVYKQLFEEGDLFLVEGNQMKQSLAGLGCPIDKIAIQHIGVDVEKIEFKTRKPPKDGKIRILMCGSFIPKKGIPFGIEAFTEVRRERDDIQLIIVGDGHMRPQIESLIEHLGISTSVSLLGYRTHVEYLEQASKAHIFMAPSLTDDYGDSEGGAPTVLLEMQAAGLPVISTFHADIPEVVVDGESGFLVAERNSDALAEKLLFLIEHPDLWESMGLAGRKHIERNYNIRIEAEKLERIYQQFVG